MAQVNAGRVRFVSKGEYNNATQYYTLDYVNYNGNSYYAKENTIGNLPTDTTKWQLVAETGNGIASITKTSTSGLVDTYTITYTNGNTTTFDVSNGKGISSIEKTGTSGSVDTYTITYTDGTTSTYTITNGEVTQEQLDEVQEELDYYKTTLNALPKVEGTGTSLTLNNTANAPMKMIPMASELEQATTLGLNYFNANAISNSNIIVNDNGKTILLPVATSGVGMVSTGKTLAQLCPDLEVGSTYYLNASRNLGSAYNTYIYLSTSNYLWNYSGSRTITQNDLDSTVALYGNNYANGETSQCILTNFRITKNSADSWEQFTFGASPNPQYPQEIHTISGDNEIIIRNQNKALLVNNFSQTVNGCTVSSKDGVYTILNTPSPSYADIRNIPLLIPYTIQSGDYLHFRNDHTDNCSIFLHYSDGSFNNPGLNTQANRIYDLSSNIGKTLVGFGINVRTDFSGAKFMFEPLIVNSATAIDYPETKVKRYSISLPPLGKNLFDKNNPALENWYNDNGVEQISNNSGHFKNKIKVQPNTQYTISGYAIVPETTASNFPRVYFYDKDGNWISRSQQIDTATSYTFTTPANCYYINFQIVLAYQTNYTVSLNTFQLEQGSSATTYERYNPLEVCKIGNYEDEFYKATASDTGLTAGKWYLKKNIGKVVLDGSENWVKESGNENRTVFSTNFSNILAYTNSQATPLLLSNYFIVVKSGKTWVNGDMSRDIGSSKVFIITSNEISTTSALATWLSTHNTEVYYAQATPTYIPLNNTLQTQLNNIRDKVLAYQNQTSITQINNDLPFIISASALLDLNTLLNNNE